MSEAATLDVPDVDIKVSEVSAEEQKHIDAAERMAGEMKDVPIGLIVRSSVALREPQTNSQKFMELVQSVRKHGVLLPILVREVQDLGVTKYGLVDGLQRWTAAQQAGMTEIPVRIVSLTDSEILSVQMIANLNRIETKAVDQSNHLLRMLSEDPLLTKEELANRCCQSTTWIDQRLALNKLTPEIQELVNTQQMKLTSAYALSQIPQEEQPQHIEAALGENPRTFTARMRKRFKEIKDAERAGRDPKSAEFEPQKHYRKLSVTKQELEVLTGETEGNVADLSVTAALQKDAKVDIAKDEKLRTVVVTTLSWALSFDSEAQAEQVQADKQRKAAADQKRKTVAAERDRRKKEREAELAGDITKKFS